MKSPPGTYLILPCQLARAILKPQVFTKKQAQQLMDKYRNTYPEAVRALKSVKGELK